MTIIIDAVKQNNFINLNKLLKKNIKTKINNKDRYGWSALHYACALGYDDLLELLINADAKLDLLSKEQNTPIDLALIFKHKACLDIIEQHFPEINANPKYQYLKAIDNEARLIINEKVGKEKYLALGKLVRDYVVCDLQIQSANYPPKPNRALQAQMHADLTKFVNIVNIFKDLKHPEGEILFAAYISGMTGNGNCSDQASVAYLLCKNLIGLRKIDICSIKNGNHWFTILGRADGSNESYQSFGRQAVVCDPWNREKNHPGVYGVDEIEIHLKDLLETGPINLLIDFMPQLQSIAIESLARFTLPPVVAIQSMEIKRSLLTYYIGGMQRNRQTKESTETKVAKVKTLEEISKNCQGLPIQSDINAVIEFKKKRLGLG